MQKPLSIDPERDTLFACVCDGMGGPGNGAQASRLVLENLKGHPNPTTEEQLRAVILNAQEDLCNFAILHPEVAGLGATIAGISIATHHVLAFNVGDSRVYRLRGGYLQLITKDHSMVQQLVDAGQLSEGDVRKHPERNVVTSALVGQANASQPELCSVRDLDTFATYLICTDGLWEALSIDEMEECLAAGAEAGAGDLAAAALAAGATDNVTFILAEVKR
jgi:protein phosphatase